MKLDRWLHCPDIWELEHSSLKLYLVLRPLICFSNFMFSRTAGTNESKRKFDPFRKYPVTLPDNQDRCHDRWLVEALEITERCEFIQRFLPFQKFARRTRQLSKMVAPTDYPTVHFPVLSLVFFLILFNWFITITFIYIKYISSLIMRYLFSCQWYAPELCVPMCYYVALQSFHIERTWWRLF